MLTEKMSKAELFILYQKLLDHIASDEKATYTR